MTRSNLLWRTTSHEQQSYLFFDLFLPFGVLGICFLFFWNLFCMNREDIIRMAREADFGDGIVEFIGVQKFERFAELVRKDYSTTHANLWLDRIHKFMLEEREACAEIAMTLTRRMEATKKAHYNHSAEPFIAERFGFDRGLILESQKIADAIRARGQA